MSDSENDPRRAVALFRYGVIAEALSLPAGSPERRAAMRAQAERAHAIPGSRRALPMPHILDLTTLRSLWHV